VELRELISSPYAIREIKHWNMRWGGHNEHMERSVYNIFVGETMVNRSRDKLFGNIKKDTN
jgi:hypothetical protein